MGNPLVLGTGASGKTELDPKALSTHAFVLGMTGSGKTGLCVVLIEELLRGGIPVIAVDSKGDLGTLLLDFEPADPAVTRWGGNPAAITTALAALGLTAEQHRALRLTRQARLFTPGASLGVPVNLLGSLAPPGANPEARAEAADGAVRGLLGLLGVDADPLSSREYLLLVQILSTAWEQGTTPTLNDLVRQVANPPFASVGALPLEDFFPQRDRHALMVRLNGLLASPRFAAWRTGEALDVPGWFDGSGGQPRLTIYSVAHLSDEERVFTVALLLERVQAWMRQQGGASTTRAVLLIDEIFGYFPPTANPPTKPPLLGLLKQARAFGVSVVLATQNPVDLDYRGLANIGTWLVGRLQTEQDKQRIRDALVSAAASTGVTAPQLDNLLARLEPRHFLLHSVHRRQPEVFKSRDTVTVLHGPFSADELRELTAPMKTAPSVPGTDSPESPSSAGAAATTPAGSPSVSSAVPVGLEPELRPVYEIDSGVGLPFLLLKFGVRYRVGTAVSEETIHELAFPLQGTQGSGEVLEGAPYLAKGVVFQEAPPSSMTLTPMPPWVASTKLAKLQALVRDRLPSKLETRLTIDSQTKLISGPTETAEAFTARVMARQELSGDGQKLLRTLEKKRADLAQAEREVSARKAEKWMSVGAGVLGLFVGRRTSVAGGVGRALSTHRQQGGAESKVEDLTIEVQQLEQQLAARKEIDPQRFSEQVAIPRASDVQVLRLGYAYLVP